MVKYIIISLIMALCITTWRVIQLARYNDDYKIANWDSALVVGLIVGYAINVLVWPINIVNELYDLW